MNVRNEVVLEYIKNERPFRICIPSGASYQETHDVLLEAISNILAMADAAKKQAEQEQGAST